MVFIFDACELDADRLELRRGGELVRVDGLVLRLLVALVQHAGQLVTKEELVDAVWQGRAVADNVITVSMARLRKTLGDKRGEREFVATVYGRGYRFVHPVERRDAGASPAAAVVQTSDAGPPLVGREPVLARLRHALCEARDGRGRLCLLMGEPGIGKTRVVEAFERELAGEGVRVAFGYCREAGDTPPLWPFLRLLRELLPHTTDRERELGTPTGEARANADGAPPDGARHHRLDALLRAFSAAAEQAPCVLVLEDLHRADAASVELLSLLLDEIGRTRLLVIATLRHAVGRSAPRPETHLPQVLGHRGCERIALERLRADEVATYVSALLDDHDGHIGRAVFAKSEGNPFFMTELSRQLRDGERVSAESLVVPSTALDLVRQGVARLHPETRDVLTAASVIGRSFELRVLSAVIDREPSELMASIDDALAEEVLVAAPDSSTAFAFGHQLLRDVLYETLQPRERRQLHLRVAKALGLRTKQGDAVAPSELAYHAHAALPDGDLHETVAYCRQAAAASAEVFANADVMRYARHALEALDLIENASGRLRMGLWFTIALYARGHASAEFVRSIAEAIRLAREQADGPMLTRCANMLNVNLGMKPLPGATAALEHALLVLDHDDLATRATALAGLACAAPACFSAERCEPLIAEAERLARKADSAPALLAALRAKLYLRGGPAHRKEADETANALERLALQNPKRMPVLPAQLAIHRAVIALQQGDPQAIQAALTHASTRCRSVRERELRWHSERFVAVSRIHSGAEQEGIARLVGLHREAGERAIFGTGPFCAFDRVVIFGERAESSPLDDRLRRALDYDASEPPSIWSLKLRTLATAGLSDEARATLHAVSPQQLAALPCDTNYLGTLGHVTRAALLLAATEYFEPLYGLLSKYPDGFCGQLSYLCEGAVPQLLGMLAQALGRQAPAIAHFEAGLAMNERAGFVARAAETRKQLAHCLPNNPR